MKPVRNPKDFLAGLLFMAFGLAALVISQPYPVGTASRMGPGYFPRLLGILLIVLGAVLSLRGFRATASKQPTWQWRPLTIVLAAVAFFSFAAPWLGLVVTAALLVVIASLARGELRWKEALASGVIQGLAAAAVFVYGLGIPLRMWPVFIGGG